MLRRSRACISIALFAAAILLCGDGASSGSSSKTTATAADGGSATDQVTSSGEQYPECRTGLPRFLSDGDCDPSTNTPECFFDGGDCCSCSCVDGPTYTCGHTGFHCLDPEVSCTDDDATCIEWEKGDSFCNEYNNNEDCSWDGGDCCACTCVDTEDNTCAGTSFNCIDPNAECFVEEDERTDDGGSTAVGEASATSTSASTCIPSKGGDGFCNYGNNIEECRYDGGDCCACTCVHSTYSCPPERFKCVDPDAECLDEDDDGWPVQVEAVESSGTGGGVGTMTSDEAGTAATNDSAYDDDVLGGGTLQNDSISVDWGGDGADSGYPEQDLSFLFSHCFSSAVDDGVCDSDNNRQECGYDGGDCCSCTCIDVPPATCGSPVPFDCHDPEVSASCAKITSQTSGTADDRSSTDLLVGAVAGAAVVVCLILGATGYCCKRARQKRRNVAAGEAASAPGPAPTNASPDGVPAISIPAEAEGLFGTSSSINSREATLV